MLTPAKSKKVKPSNTKTETIYNSNPNFELINRLLLAIDSDKSQAISSILESARLQLFTEIITCFSKFIGFELVLQSTDEEISFDVFIQNFIKSKQSFLGSYDEHKDIIVSVLKTLFSINQNEKTFVNSVKEKADSSDIQSIILQIFDFFFKCINFEHNTLDLRTFELIQTFFESVLNDHSLSINEKNRLLFSELLFNFAKIGISHQKTSIVAKTINIFLTVSEEMSNLEFFFSQNVSMFVAFVNSLFGKLIEEKYCDFAEELTHLIKKILVFKLESLRSGIETSIHSMKNRLIDSISKLDSKIQELCMGLLISIFEQKFISLRLQDMRELDGLIFTKQEQISEIAFNFWIERVKLKHLADNFDSTNFKAFIQDLGTLENVNRQELLQKIVNSVETKNLASTSYRFFSENVSNDGSLTSFFLKVILEFILSIKSKDQKFEENFSKTYRDLFSFCGKFNCISSFLQIVLTTISLNDHLCQDLMNLLNLTDDFAVICQIIKYFYENMETNQLSAKVLEDIYQSEKKKYLLFVVKEKLLLEDVIMLHKLRYLCRIFYKDYNFIKLEKIKHILDFYFTKNLDFHCAEVISSILHIFLANVKNKTFRFFTEKGMQNTTKWKEVEVSRQECIEELENYIDYKPHNENINKIDKKKVRYESFNILIELYCQICSDGYGFLNFMSYCITDSNYIKISRFLTTVQTKFIIQTKRFPNNNSEEFKENLKYIDGAQLVLNSYLDCLLKSCQRQFTLKFGHKLFILLSQSYENEKIINFVKDKIKDALFKDSESFCEFRISQMICKSIKDCVNSKVLESFIEFICAIINSFVKEHEKQTWIKAKIDHDLGNLIILILSEGVFPGRKFIEQDDIALKNCMLAIKRIVESRFCSNEFEKLLKNIEFEILKVKKTLGDKKIGVGCRGYLDDLESFIQAKTVQIKGQIFSRKNISFVESDSGNVQKSNSRPNDIGLKQESCKKIMSGEVKDSRVSRIEYDPLCKANNSHIEKDHFAIKKKQH